MLGLELFLLLIQPFHLKDSFRKETNEQLKAIMVITFAFEKTTNKHKSNHQKMQCMRSDYSDLYVCIFVISDLSLAGNQLRTEPWLWLTSKLSFFYNSYGICHSRNIVISAELLHTHMEDLIKKGNWLSNQEALKLCKSF